MKGRRWPSQREKSESLLLNIMPAAIAMRLKEGEHVIADEHPEATVMFADIVGFTNISQNISPTMLVENLNKIFTHFDKLVEQYEVEKIKTIGDAYMAVSGLNGHTQEHAKKMADLALMMLCDIEKFSLDGKNKCTVRVGIHIGPVIAGVIGSKKFSYDIWGDTVNTAQRMESTCEPGKIQVSEKFYNTVKEDFDFELRGQTEVKGERTDESLYPQRKKGIDIRKKYRMNIFPHRSSLSMHYAGSSMDKFLRHPGSRKLLFIFSIIGWKLRKDNTCKNSTSRY